MDVVFLDVDGTLLDFHQNAQWAIAQCAAHQGLRLPDSFMPAFHRINNALWYALEKGELSLSRLHEVRFQKIFESLHLSGDAAGFEDDFVALLRESCIPVEGALSLVKALSDIAVVCVASNAPRHQQERRMTLAGMAPYISRYFVSEAIGAAKPSPAFFAYCQHAFPDIAPDRMCMIGDSLHADMEGAHLAGMHTVWFTSPLPAVLPESVDWATDRLSDIPPLLRK